MSYYAEGIDTQNRLICYVNNPASNFSDVTKIQAWTKKASSVFHRCVKLSCLQTNALLESTLKPYTKKESDLKRVEYLDLQEDRGDDQEKVSLYFRHEFVILYKKVVSALEILDFAFSKEPRILPYLTSSLALDILTKSRVEQEREETLIFESEQSMVYRLNLSGHELVRKKFRDQNEKDEIATEYRLLLKLNDERFTKVAHATSSDLYLNFIQAVTFRAATFTVEEGFDCLLQVLSALEFLHLKKISHQDIHPENVLVSLDCKKVFIIDFASARALSELRRKEDLDCFAELISFWILKNEEELPKEVYKNLESFSNTIKSKDFLSCYHEPYEVIKAELRESYEEYQIELHQRKKQHLNASFSE